MEILVHKKFEKDYKNFDKSQKKEIIRRMDRVAEGNYGKGRNLPKGLIEIKFDSGVRIYGGVLKKDGKEAFVAINIGGKANASQQNNDIQYATGEYVKLTGQKNMPAFTRFADIANSR